MGTIRFTKIQGAGNDFVLVETRDGQRDWSRLAATLCDRHFGVGADGLLLLMPAEDSDFRMRVFNADGSEAEVCGNGLRCMVRYFIENRPAGTLGDDVSVKTASGIRRARFRRSDGREAEIQVSMGEPRIGSENLPVQSAQSEGSVDIKRTLTCMIGVGGRELEVCQVSMGNPHAVHFTQEPVERFPLPEIGPLVEHHPAFPGGTNFEVVNVVGRGGVEARVWERGVGETLACGSGACAVVVAGHLLDHLERKATVRLPGGVLGVEWNGSGEVYLSGPAEVVFTGEWPDTRRERAG